MRRLKHIAASGVVLTSMLASGSAFAATGTPDQGVQAQAVGTLEDLGAPITSYLILDSVSGSDKHGRPMLYGSTYAASSPGVMFFAIDVQTNEIVKQLPMEGSWGGYHTTLGSDGRVYMATQSGDGLAHLWRYDPDTEQVEIVATTDETDIGHTFFFGVNDGAHGKVYGGTYPSGKLIEYDQKKQTLRDLGAVEEGRLYAKAITPIDARRVFVGGGTPASANIVDVKTGERTSILPPEYANYSFAYNSALVGKHLLVQALVPDSRVLRFDLERDKAEFVGEVPALSGTGILPINDHEAYATGTCPGESFGVVKYNVKTGACQRLTDASWVSSSISKVKVDGDTWLTSVGLKGLYGRYNVPYRRARYPAARVPGLRHQRHGTAHRAGRSGVRRHVRDQRALPHRRYLW